VLLIALWVRSYWVLDYICQCDSNNIMTIVGSQWGLVYVAHFDAYGAYRGTGISYASHGWEYRTHKSYAFNSPVWEHDSDGINVNLPHWSYVIVFTLLAAIPWIGKLPWQFSLRTLLIATTLIAVVLGLCFGAR
jgi:hypothetical protein